jgi:hypothetical protein
LENQFEGTVSQDFLTLINFIKKILLILSDIPRKDFEIFPIFEELFVFVIDSLVYLPLGNQPELVYKKTCAKFPGSQGSL